VLLSLAVKASAADLAVDIFFSPLTDGTFQYGVTIRNTGLTDISIVTITDAPPNDSLIGSTLTAPSGFLANYEPLGFLDFLEDTQLFGAGTTWSGFSFQSAVSPQANFSMFEALTSGGEILSGSITIVPEPGTVVLAICGLIALAGARRGKPTNQPQIKQRIQP
jgi:uncharacterized repeat protein (TIGR01451 family)